jgi:hypothetical protein
VVLVLPSFAILVAQPARASARRTASQRIRARPGA